MVIKCGFTSFKASSLSCTKQTHIFFILLCCVQQFPSLSYPAKRISHDISPFSICIPDATSHACTTHNHFIRYVAIFSNAVPSYGYHSHSFDPFGSEMREHLIIMDKNSVYSGHCQTHEIIWQVTWKKPTTAAAPHLSRDMPAMIPPALISAPPVS